MPIHVDAVLLHTISGTELSRVRTEFDPLCIFPALPPHPVQPHSQSAGHGHLGYVPLPVRRDGPVFAWSRFVEQLRWVRLHGLGASHSAQRKIRRARGKIKSPTLRDVRRRAGKVN